MEDELAIRRALAYYQHGADFADALHLATVGDTALYTLDKVFCKQAIRKGIAPNVIIVSTGAKKP